MYRICCEMWRVTYYRTINDVSNNFRVARAGALKKAIDLRNELFQYFIDSRSSLKARLPKNIYLAKARSLYTECCKLQREQCEEPSKLTFSNHWLKDWCKEYQISMKNQMNFSPEKLTFERRELWALSRIVWTKDTEF